MGITRIAALRSGACSHSIHSGVSVTGTVFGMEQTVVKPPAAAARVPLAMVSFQVWPGSRRCTWMSISPGATSSPAASSTSASSSAARDDNSPGIPIAATLPVTKSKSRGSPSLSAERSAFGCTSRPPAISNGFCCK
jgi:hypothetical protein